MEISQRKNIRDSTKRSLFLKSGNYCAICNAILLNKDGDYLGEIAHIESANKGGKRYNKVSNDEDRRNESNLMLLCGNCHKKIDGENSNNYSVKALKEIKEKHEAKFTNNVKRVLDLTESESKIYPQNIKRWATQLEVPDEYWNNKEDKKEIELFKCFLDRLSVLPRAVRDTYVILIMHSKNYTMITEDKVSALLEHELDNFKYVKILVQDDFIYYDDSEFTFSKFGFDFDLIESFAEYAQKIDMSFKDILEEIFINLNLSVLDDIR